LPLADRRLATLDAIAKICDEAGIETFPRKNDYSDLIERVRLMSTYVDAGRCGGCGLVRGDCLCDQDE
jgi:hypothetical protein